MKRLILGTILSAISLLAMENTATEQSQNKGLLGATYIKVYVGTTKFGDDEVADIMDSNTQIGIKGQFKINDNLSLGGSLGFAGYSFGNDEFDGTAGITYIALDGFYHFLPSETIDPFISIGLAYVSTDLLIIEGFDIYDESDSDSGYMFSAGAEFDLTDKIFLTPALSYVKIGDEDASINVSAEIDFEVVNNFYLGGRINVELEETDISYYVGLGYKF